MGAGGHFRDMEHAESILARHPYMERTLWNFSNELDMCHVTTTALENNLLQNMIEVVVQLFVIVE